MALTVTEANTRLAGILAANTFAQNASELSYYSVSPPRYSTGIKSIVIEIVTPYPIIYLAQQRGSYTLDASGNVIVQGTIPAPADYVGTANIRVLYKYKEGTTTDTSSPITIVAYAAPQILSFSVFRSDASGAPQRDGTYAAFMVNAGIASLSSCNTARYVLKYRAKGASTWTARTLATSGYSYTASNSLVVASASFDAQTAYEFQFEATDLNSTATASASIATAFAPWALTPDGTGFGIGKFPEQNNLFDVSPHSRFRQNLQVDGALTIASVSFANPAAARKALGMGSIIGILSSRSIPTRGTNLNCYKITMTASLTINTIDNPDVIGFNSTTGAFIAKVTGRYRITGCIFKNTSTNGSIGWARLCIGDNTFAAADYYATTTLQNTFPGVQMPLEHSYTAASATGIAYTFGIVLNLTANQGVWVYINDSGAAGSIDGNVSSLSMEKI